MKVMHSLLHITFTGAIENVSRRMDAEKGYTIWKASRALAEVFNINKEQALRALMDYRKNRPPTQAAHTPANNKQYVTHRLRYLGVEQLKHLGV